MQDYKDTYWTIPQDLVDRIEPKEPIAIRIVEIVIKWFQKHQTGILIFTDALIVLDIVILLAGISVSMFLKAELIIVPESFEYEAIKFEGIKVENQPKFRFVITVRNDGRLKLEVKELSIPSWLTITSFPSESINHNKLKQIVVKLKNDLAPPPPSGRYEIKIRSNGGTISVPLIVSTLSFSPRYLHFKTRKGERAEKKIVIRKNIGKKVELLFEIPNNCNWLSVPPHSIVIDPNNSKTNNREVTVEARTKGLQAGDYNSNLTVKLDGKNFTKIPVFLKVKTPDLEVSPKKLGFEFAHFETPDVQNITVRLKKGDSFDGEIRIKYLNGGGPWISDTTENVTLNLESPTQSIPVSIRTESLEEEDEKEATINIVSRGKTIASVPVSVFVAYGYVEIPKAGKIPQNAFVIEVDEGNYKLGNDKQKAWFRRSTPEISITNRNGYEFTPIEDNPDFYRNRSIFYIGYIELRERKYPEGSKAQIFRSSDGMPITKPYLIELLIQEGRDPIIICNPIIILLLDKSETLIDVVVKNEDNKDIGSKYSFPIKLDYPLSSDRW